MRFAAVAIEFNWATSTGKDWQYSWPPIIMKRGAGEERHSYFELATVVNSLGESVVQNAPPLLITGLGCLALAVVGSPFGAMTGCGLVALGACGTLANRPDANVSLLGAQLIVYGGLYVLFLAATLDGALTGNPSPLGRMAVASDFLASAVVMAGHAPILRCLADRTR